MRHRVRVEVQARLQPQRVRQSPQAGPHQGQRDRMPEVRQVLRNSPGDQKQTVRVTNYYSSIIKLDS